MLTCITNYDDFPATGVAMFGACAAASDNKAVRERLHFRPLPAYTAYPKLPPVTQPTWLRARFLLHLLILTPFPLVAQPGGPLAPGDRVTLRLPGETSPRELLEVDHRGILVLPRVGPINATQLQLTQLTDSIRALYKPMFNSGDVTVLLLRRITVLGEVKRPGVLYMDPSSSVRDAIASAEGATESADISHVNLIRGNASQRIPGWELVSADSVPLRSGDALMIDRESWIRRNVSSLLGALGILASITVALSR